MKNFVIDFISAEAYRDGFTVEITAPDWDTARNIFRKTHPRCAIVNAKMIVELSINEDRPLEYRDAIVALIDKQRAKGLEKYGQTLEDNTTLTNEQRIEHAQEELVDALQYLEHLKQTQADRLTANDFQRAAMRTASGMDHEGYNGRGLLLNAVMGLNGEAGEVIDHVKKVCFQGHELDREHMVEELGDVAWYLAVCAEALGVTLEEILQHNIDKLKARYPEGFDKARSINRKEAADNGQTD